MIRTQKTQTINYDKFGRIIKPVYGRLQRPRKDSRVVAASATTIFQAVVLLAFGGIMLQSAHIILTALMK